MDDEQKLLKQREMGAHAKRLKEDDLLNRIFEGLRAQYTREWACTEVGDTKSRENSFLQLHALLDVRAQLNAICADGETATKFLEHAEKFKRAAA